jgi:transcriptional regulator with XRE-family HTH domain
MVERIKKLLQKQNLTPSQFAAEVGVQRSAVSHLLSGRNKPSLDFMLKVKRHFPEIRLDWLLLGEGRMMETAKKVETEVPKVAQDLFAVEKEVEQKSDEEIKDETGLKEMELPYHLLKSEDAPVYGNPKSGIAQSPTKIILLYSDHHFEVYNTSS